MNRLKELRTAAGLSRAQLAEASGVNIRTLEAYEQGVRDLDKMALVTAVKISEALQCSPADLL